MELNWTTFLLEIVNFLVLVWLLKRFLYRPVLGIIEKRRQKIADELARAASLHEEVDTAKQEYAQRLAHWEEEKRLAKESLDQDIAREREHRLGLLDEELAKRKEQRSAQDRREQERLKDRAESEALQLGAVFAARLLGGLAGPELDQRLQQLFIEQVSSLPDTTRNELEDGWNNGSSEVEVTSAAPLDAARQQALRGALEAVLGPSGRQWRFSQDGGLIAGLRVSFGGWVLEANLKDELRFFAEAAHG